MKTRLLLLTIFSLMVGNLFSQTMGTEPGGTLTSLLPDGVKANIDSDRRATMRKNIMVAGSKDNGYVAYFAATEATHGEELWVTDGTPAGTKMVKDINPGAVSSNIEWLARFNDKVVFAANDGSGVELWISDGSSAGTRMIKDIHILGDSNPKGFTQVNENQFIFTAMDMDSEAEGQYWLWVSDGTEEGTNLIYECDMKYPGNDNTSWHHPYCRVGRKVFFKADYREGGIGEELWVTDGTRGGTYLVKDVNVEPESEGGTGTRGSSLDDMINFYNEKLFFKAWCYESGEEPFASNGTEAGTYMIYDTRPGTNDAGSPYGGGVSEAGLKPYKGKVYYRGWDNVYGREIAATNLLQGDYQIWEINKNVPGADGLPKNSSPDPGVEFDSVYMFCANTGLLDTEISLGGELHYCDGENVYMQSDLGPGKQSNWVKELTVASGSLYWWNESTEDSEKATKLFRIDNKEQFPVRVTNINPGADDKVHTLRNIGGDLIFATNNGDALYCYEYRKEGYDPETEADDLEIEYRTRDEIAAGIVTNKMPEVITIYPNPTSDMFNFSVAGNVQSMKIFDITGSLIKNETQLSRNTVDVSSFTKGVYKVLIISSQGAFVSSLIIN